MRLVCSVRCMLWRVGTAAASAAGVGPACRCSPELLIELAGYGDDAGRSALLCTPRTALL